MGGRHISMSAFSESIPFAAVENLIAEATCRCWLVLINYTPLIANGITVTTSLMSVYIIIKKEFTCETKGQSALNSTQVALRILPDWTAYVHPPLAYWTSRTYRPQKRTSESTLDTSFQRREYLQTHEHW